MSFAKKYSAGINLIFKQRRIDILMILVLYLKYSFIVSILPLKYYSGNFDAKPLISIDQLQPILKDIRLIKSILNHLPFSVSCLVESLVIKAYFKRIKIDVPIALGVKKEDNLVAHAWYLPSNQFGHIRLNKRT